MSFPRYPKYKASGVEWLGDVPEGWEVKRLRFVASLNPSKSEVAELDRETAVSFLPMEAVGDDGTLVLDKEKTIGELETGYTYFRDGDVTIAKITPCYENGKGAIMRGLLNGIGFGTTELIVARPMAAEITSTYLHYLFISPDFRGLGESHMYGAGGQKRVPDAFVRNFATGIPPLPEQTAIAEFLDRETGKIDELVAEQRRLMELLKEKRQAVISHAVTKGLNPHAPMKPSGIEWLGDVPVGWEVGPLKIVATHNDDTLDEKTEPDLEILYVDISGVDAIDGIKTKEAMVFSAAPSRARRRVKHGDTIVSTVRTYLRAIAQVRNPEENLIVSTGFAVVRPRARLSPDFVGYVLSAGYFIEQVIARSTGVSYPAINASDLVRIPVVLPLLPEQTAIAEFLDSESAKFDTLTAEAQRAIELLQERRTALISAAVTGQIDVRQQPRN